MRRLRPVAAALAVAVLLTGCVGLPHEGPVVDADVAGERDSDQVSSIDARPPQPGASRLEVVNGFLDAMMAWPISTSVAKEFLTDDAAEEWSPDETVIYTELGAEREDGSSVSIRMSDATLLDGSGAWRGPLHGDRSVLRFRLTVEDGEFRILDPMDALVVRTSWFQQRYRQASLYFFDPTAQVLVPEPVFVPVGETFATNLVTALLAGPPPRLRGVVQTFLPAGLSVGLSVPVSDGVASLDLRGDAPRTSSDQAKLLLAQLAATLRQEPDIAALRVTIGGEEIDPPGAASQYDVGSADEFDPADTASDGILFGLQRGRVVSGTVDGLRPVDGPLGREPHRFAAISVAPAGDRIATVAPGGSQVRVSPLRGAPGAPDAETIVAEGTELVRPSWDASGRLWLLDRDPRGARLLVSDDGGPAEEIEVAGVSGADVRRILVSRDGTLMIALVVGRNGDQLVAARIVLDGFGRVERVIESNVIRTFTGRAIDIAWSNAAEIAVLSPASPGVLFEVETVAADGATIGVDTLATMVSGRVTGIAGEPTPDTPVYAVARDAVVDISTGERLTNVTGVRELDYAG